MAFSCNARIFKLQSSRAWEHCGSGVLTSNARTRSFAMSDSATRAVLLNHVVSPGEILEKSVSAGAWVFKVASGEFVCLQFPVASNAEVFKSVHTTFASPAVAAAAAAAPRRRSGPSATEAPARGAAIRRRMTLFGAETNLDGLGSAVAQGRRASSMQHDSSLSRRGGLGLGVGVGSSPAAACVLTTYDGESRKGYHPHNPRKVNQDRMVIERHPTSGAVLLCVFDGHGQFGHDVSSYMKRNYPAAVFRHAAFAAGDVCTALAQALVDTEWQMLSDPTLRERSTLSGTTAVCSCVIGNMLYVANAGDSRISNNGVAVSIDNKPDNPGEKERIEARGGRVFAVHYDDGGPSPARVWLRDQDLPGTCVPAPPPYRRFGHLRVVRPLVTLSLSLSLSLSLLSLTHTPRFPPSPLLSSDANQSTTHHWHHRP